MVEVNEVQSSRLGKFSPSRISWGAIFGGLVVLLVSQLALSLLGLAIGAGEINPLKDSNPLSGMGTSSAVWLIASTIISLFLAGWVVGRLAGTTSRGESALHGIIVWGLGTLATAYLVTTAVGSMLGGAAGLLGKGMSMAGQGVAAVAPKIGGAIGENIGGDEAGLWNDLQNEVQTTLKQTGKSDLQPKALERRARGAVNDAKSTASTSAKNPDAVNTDAKDLFNRLKDSAGKTLSSADREALVNVVVARTNMTPEEANQSIDKWQKTIADTQAKLQLAKQQAEQKAREVADATAHAVSKAAAWGFIALVIGAIFSALGALCGAAFFRHRHSTAVATTVPASTLVGDRL